MNIKIAGYQDAGPGIARFSLLPVMRTCLVSAGLWIAATGMAAGAGQTGSEPRVVEPLAAGNLVQMTLGLLAVLLLLGGLAWFMRRVVRIQGVAGGSLRVAAFPWVPVSASY